MSGSEGYATGNGGPSRSPVVAPVKVLCLGPPRAGASSIQAALGMLGYHETYYFPSSINDRSRDTQAWLDAFDAVFEGKGTFKKGDFDRLFAGCQAVVGRPCCAFAPQLIKAYPEAKVILNTRDVDEWYMSWIRLIKTRMAREQEQGEVNLEPEDEQKVAAKMLRNKILYAFFQGDFIKTGKAAFKEHFNEICQLVPKDKLLIYDIKDGWNPLCEFLGKSVPSEPFPGHDALEVFEDKSPSQVNGTAGELKSLHHAVVAVPQEAGVEA
ncbi:putative NAD dependent epimerase/dehydratase [Histoplasma ohiense]|nr:putative NAD dependent epimerase/dehydratase [Histoplasma ohiense (nom. inval.)]